MSEATIPPANDADLSLDLAIVYARVWQYCGVSVGLAESLVRVAAHYRARLAAVTAERDRLAELPEWVVGKLKTLGEYYDPPTDGRDVVSEIQGWMHVLCFHYVQNRREVKEYDAARREAKTLRADLDAARAEAARLRARVAELEALCRNYRALADAAKRGITERQIWDAVQRVVADDPTVSMTDLLSRALALADADLTGRTVK